MKTADKNYRIACLSFGSLQIIKYKMENGCMYTAEVYTDGSKIGNNVGAAGIISVNRKLVHQLKFKLHGHCYNNQAEQIAII